MTATLTDLTPAEQAAYEAGRLAGLEEALEIASMYSQNARDKHDWYSDYAKGGWAVHKRINNALTRAQMKVSDLLQRGKL